MQVIRLILSELFKLDKLMCHGKRIKTPADTAGSLFQSTLTPNTKTAKYCTKKCFRVKKITALDL